MARRDRTKNVVGLELEPGSIAAARVTVAGRIAVQQAAVAPLDAHVVRDGEVNDVEALASAIGTLFKEHKGLGKHVRVGVANARIVVRTLELPLLEGRELEAAVRFHADQELPMPLDQAVLDFIDVGTVETPGGPRKRVVVVAARRDMVERVLAAVRAAGLKVAGVDLSAFAMVRALQHDTVPTLYLSIGGVTNLAIADQSGVTFTRVTGGGLEHMVVGTAERLAAPLDEAREWILRVGLGRSLDAFGEDGDTAATVLTVLEAGVRQIAGEVRGSLDFYAQAVSGPPVERVVLTGPATRVPGFAAALHQELGLPVDARTVEEAKPGALGDVDPARVTVAAGLAVSEMPS